MGFFVAKTFFDYISDKIAGISKWKVIFYFYRKYVLQFKAMSLKT